MSIERVFKDGRLQIIKKDETSELKQKLNNLQVENLSLKSSIADMYEQNSNDKTQLQSAIADIYESIGGIK